MHSTTIRPAQLMMEFMAGEQDRIGQGIASQEFSRQLEEQSLKTVRPQEMSPEATSRPQRQSAADGQVHRTSRKTRAARVNGARNPKDPTNRLAKVRHGRTPNAEAEPTQQWKAAKQLRFADSMSLEKVLTSLQVSPALRESLQGHSLLNGSVSLQQVSTTLDQALQAQDAVPTKGKVEASEVRGLLGSLQSGQSSALGADNQLQLKAAGYYDLAEFRQLLQRIVKLSAEHQAPKNAGTSLGASGETASTNTSPSAPPTGTAIGKLTSQPESTGIFLARTLLQDGAVAPGNNPAAASRSLPPSAGGSAPMPAAGAQGVTAAPETVVPYSQVQDMAGMTSSVPRGGSSNPAAAVEARLSGGNPQAPGPGGSNGAVIGPNLAPTNLREAAATAAGTVMPTVMSLIKNLEGNAQAVIRGLHLEPEVNRSLSNQSVNTDSVLSKTLTGELMEKIAAPEQSSGGTSDHPGDQQNLSAFVRQDGAVAVPGGASAGAHAPGAPSGSVASWAQALAERVLEMQKHKQSQLTLEVESKDLGRVLLRVETDNNQVRAIISTESEQARNMLHRSAPELRQQLEAQGLVLGQLLVDVQERRGERNPWQQRGTHRSKDLASARPVAAASRQGLSGSAVQSLGLGEQLINVFA